MVIIIFRYFLKMISKNNKKYFEIYSDLNGPLFTEYKFFEGLSGGKLLFSSIIDESILIQNSRLKTSKLSMLLEW